MKLLRTGGLSLTQRDEATREDGVHDRNYLGDTWIWYDARRGGMGRVAVQDGSMPVRNGGERGRAQKPGGLPAQDGELVGDVGINGRR